MAQFEMRSSWQTRHARKYEFVGCFVDSAVCRCALHEVTIRLAGPIVKTRRPITHGSGRSTIAGPAVGYSDVYFFPELVFSGSSSRMRGSWKCTAGLGVLKQSASVKSITVLLSLGARAERAARRLSLGKRRGFG